jgi:hypothetical protein
MCRIRSIFFAAATAAVVTAGIAPAAFARPLDDCHKPPPAWYTAPRYTNTYSQVWGSGYSHDYSAQRRSYSSRSYAPARRYYTTSQRHDPFGRW